MNYITDKVIHLEKETILSRWGIHQVVRRGGKGRGSKIRKGLSTGGREKRRKDPGEKQKWEGLKKISSAVARN